MGLVGDGTAPVPGFIRDTQRRAARAAKPVEISEAPTRRAMTRLVRAGWDFKERCGKRIWSHETITGGFWVSEEIAIHRNDKRKG